MKHRFLIGGVAAVMLAASSLVLHAHGDSAAEHAVEVRQSIMTLVADNFGPLAGMVQGKIPWDNSEFHKRASDINAVTSIDLLRGYIPDSHHSGTAAKAKIWDNMDDFRDKMETLRTEVVKLAKVSAGGDQEAMTAQFKETANACKGCHEEYKNKEKN